MECVLIRELSKGTLKLRSELSRSRSTNLGTRTGRRRSSFCRNYSISFRFFVFLVLRIRGLSSTDFGDLSAALEVFVLGIHAWREDCEMNAG